eukprot:TRINITY_DN12352_c0_g1_i1.p1 TRINITY_DN12352_c0_g1~~TRINITY_DN12352_c0_g1_i1.p1  ORF type:complete len:478 (-),score=67.58 TRINITY_DN12352_c0_g1_i1:197-1630(-)
MSLNIRQLFCHQRVTHRPIPGLPNPRNPCKNITMSFAWDKLRGLCPPPPDLVNGPTNAKSRLRLFGYPESAVRVTLYRDHHAWCPYCQKVWLWLEERRVPYRVAKVTMFCYGHKESWYTRLVPSGMLPAIDLDGRIVTESDEILNALESTFGPLHRSMSDPEVIPLRRLERHLFRAWCGWLCRPHRSNAEESASAAQFARVMDQVASALDASPGPFFLPPAPSASLLPPAVPSSPPVPPPAWAPPLDDGFSTADVVFVPYVERMAASLFYYKGLDIRATWPAMDRWFRALERRQTYLGTQSDFHTHAHDLPPQMGGCFASDTDAARAAAAAVDRGGDPRVPETSVDAPPSVAALEALSAVVRHHPTLAAVNPDQSAGRFDTALRTALTRLACDAGLAAAEPAVKGSLVPPRGSSAGLLYLRDRISVPRDMGVLAARALRGALRETAAMDASDPGPDLPVRHRRDQDPARFVPVSAAR